MTRFERAAATLLAAALLTRSLSAQTAPQNPTTQVAVTVTAEDARRIRDATNTIRNYGDPFLANLATQLGPLITAMAGQGKTFTLGPLTARELSAVDLTRYLTQSPTPGDAPIQLQVRRTWTELDPTVYGFSEVGLLVMLASMAKGPTVQLAEKQRAQVVWLGRAVLDFNWQAGGIIPERQIFAALAKEFRDKTVGERLVGTVRSMADSAGRYDLVPRRLLQDFQQRAEPGFLIQAPAGQAGVIKLKYGEGLYATRPDHLIWSFLRMFAGDNSGDWAEKAMARERSVLARSVLDYLEAQVRMDAIDAMWATLAAPPEGLAEISIGVFRLQGPVAAVLKAAPGVSGTSVPKDPELASFVVQSKKVPELRAWIDAQTVAWQAVLEK